jgi:hypothetical protein
VALLRPTRLSGPGCVLLPCLLVSNALAYGLEAALWSFANHRGCRALVCVLVRAYDGCMDRVYRSSVDRSGCAASPEGTPGNAQPLIWTTFGDTGGRDGCSLTP